MTDICSTLYIHNICIYSEYTESGLIDLLIDLHKLQLGPFFIIDLPSRKIDKHFAHDYLLWDANVSALLLSICAHEKSFVFKLYVSAYQEHIA